MGIMYTKQWRVFLLFLFACAFFAPNSYAFRLGKKGPRVYGFIENGFGAKFDNDEDTKHRRYNMAEQRVQLKTRFFPENPAFLYDWDAEVNVKAEFVSDEYYDITLDKSFREFSLSASPLSFMDIKVGKQIFTWGTGDYLFINDMFPKDYISFYIGRHDEYLKKPSYGAKASIYLKKSNLDLVYLPFFVPNSAPNGTRLSFYDVFQQGIVGESSRFSIHRPDRTFRNAEYAARWYGNISGYEWAFYYFNGYYKNPCGFYDEMNRVVFYPRVSVYGASLRGAIFRGIGSVEFGYIDSRQDRSGENRLIPNDKVKLLAGYEKDLGNDFRIGLQHQFSRMLDYDNYDSSLMPWDLRYDKIQHLSTLRLTKLFKSQTVRASLFVFYSETDRDTYWRPFLSWDVTDQFNVTVGANLMWGDKDTTDFGQMEQDKNVYVRFRWSF